MKINFQKYASISAFGAAVSALAYAYFFVIAKDATMFSLFLMLIGLFGLKVAVYLYERLKDIDRGFAGIGAVLLIAGSLGSMVHGGYDLANALNPPASANLDLPSQVDPRGLLAFGLTGLGILKFSWLATKDKMFPRNFAFLGMASGILLVVVYLGRLIVLDPTNPILLYPVLIEGFIVSPLWYLWLGSILRKG